MKYVFLFALTITIIAGIITFGLAPILQSPVISPSETFPNGTSIPTGWLECEKNNDCFPAECCHPTFCVNDLGRLDCMGALCTQECRKGTMDCGCGSCVCVNKKCAVKFIESEFCSVT